MNTKDMHGKQISQVWWTDTDNEQGRIMSATDTMIFEMSATHHGDHDEFWIVQLEKISDEFRETARHNVRYVEGFDWA